ncbi:MAG: sulfite exporter TauE/SafE family protein [Nocardioidaceae bacterium]
MHDPSTLTVLLLALAGLSAGFVDAVVGGGGLIQLPALVVAFPGAAPVAVLATNKLGSVCGTTVSSATYYRRVRPDPRTFVPLMALAFLGSALGAVAASHLPKSAFDPIILAVLVLVGGYTLLRPGLGRATQLRFSGHRHTLAAMAAGAGIGFYDGALGPGTGSFFVFTLVGLLGYSFLEGSAKAKMANWATNLAAFLVFLPQGVIAWKVGLVLGGCNLLGSYVGARTAVARGSGFVRGFFICVVAVFIVKIGGDVLGLDW